MLQDNGTLTESSTDGIVTLHAPPNGHTARTVVAVSDQGFDTNGRAMIDVITNDGTAFEYHDAGGSAGGWFELWSKSDPWTWPLATHGQSVVSARAGQGVSYVLLSDNSLNVWHDSGSTWDSQINLGTPISAIDAGTDRYGVNKLDVLFKAGFVSEWDGSAFHLLATSGKSISAGQRGYSTILTPQGTACLYDQAGGGQLRVLATNVSSLSIGTTLFGTLQVDAIMTDGSIREGYGADLKVLTPPKDPTGPVRWIGKAHQGIVDVIFGNGWAEEHDRLNHWSSILGHGAVAVV